MMVVEMSLCTVYRISFYLLFQDHQLLNIGIAELHVT
jgi:hypothetical protein